MVTIQNDILSIDLSPKGAELQSILLLPENLEYLWGGDPAYWAKRSPVLFPIVGTLKNDIYYYEDRVYRLNRHGFARDMDFEIEKQDPESAFFLLKDSAATLVQFPFNFELRIWYMLNKNRLAVRYSVKNPSEKELYFSVGAHPAFKVPLVPDTMYSDYYLEFNRPETLSRWPISPEGLLEKRAADIAVNGKTLSLTHELFQQDALVFKQLNSSMVSLRSNRTAHRLDFDFSEFPYLGVWAAKNADFVCIEPWCGIADGTGSNQQIVDKEGINRLGPGDLFTAEWKVEFY